jgi:hypothetical protein
VKTICTILAFLALMAASTTAGATNPLQTTPEASETTLAAELDDVCMAAVQEGRLYAGPTYTRFPQMLRAYAVCWLIVVEADAQGVDPAQPAAGD